MYHLAAIILSVSFKHKYFSPVKWNLLLASMFTDKHFFDKILPYHKLVAITSKYSSDDRSTSIQSKLFRSVNISLPVWLQTPPTCVFDKQQKIRACAVFFDGVLYTVDPLYHGAWGPISTNAIYLNHDISRDTHY